MKILQVNKFYYLKGGSERHFFGLEKSLGKAGHKVIPFSMGDPRNKESEYSKYFIEPVDLNNFSIRNIVKYFWNYDAVGSLRRLIKEESPDVAHLHNIAGQISPAIIHVLKENKIPVVQTLHDYKLICPNYMLYQNDKVCEECRGAKYYKCFQNKCVKGSRAKSLLATLEAYLHNKVLKSYDKVDKFIAPSQFMRDKCVQFGVSPERIEVIRNSVDAVQATAKTEDYFLYFGRLSREKGLDFLLDAFSIMQNYKLKIVGDGELKAGMEEIISSKNLDNIELLGYKSGEELEKLIQGSKAVLFASRWYENMPYSMLEAMASGKPVIVSSMGGMAEIIESGVNGFVFREGDKGEFNRIILNIDSYDLDSIGESAKSVASEQTNKDYAEKLEKIYKKIT